MSTIINATTTNGVVIQPDNSGSLQLATNSGTTAVTIDTSQNVGIGTASPSSRLAVSSASDTNLSVTNGSNGNTAILRAGGTSVSVQTAQSIPMLFSTSATERMRIDSSGNVLIGTTTTRAKVTIAGVSGQGGQFPLYISSFSDGGIYRYIEFRATNGGTQTGFIESTNGTTTTYATTSDYRLKENIVPMTGALDKVAQLKPVTYTWKADGSDGQGFIAHELAEVVPDCVTGEKDAVEIYTDEEGNEQTRIKAQGIDTSFLVATLTAAIQEQQTIINDLKARVETLEAK